MSVSTQQAIALAKVRHKARREEFLLMAPKAEGSYWGRVRPVQPCERFYSGTEEQYAADMADAERRLAKAKRKAKS